MNCLYTFINNWPNAGVFEILFCIFAQVHYIDEIEVHK